MLVVLALKTTCLNLRLIEMPRLIVDTEAISHNYCAISRYIHPALCAAVVKCDAYGMGMIPVSKDLYKSGCRDFFVATFEEGRSLRQEISDENCGIYVLNGIQKGWADNFSSNKIIPVLNTAEEVMMWDKKPMVMHYDTGLGRMGMAKEELFQQASPDLIISHLACGYDEPHTHNILQNTRMNEAAHRFQSSKISLAASGALFFDDFLEGYKYDMVRIGRILLGSLGVNREKRGLYAEMRNVLKLEAQILHIKTLETGESVGYNRRHINEKPTTIAVLDIGYGTGYRYNKGMAYVNSAFAKILGDISMDLLAIDITDISDVEVGDYVELLGENVTFDMLCERTGLSPGAISTAIGGQVLRCYK